DKALKLGEDNLDLLSEDDPIIIFLIKDILGKRLYLNEKYKKAIKFLKAALNQADKVDIKDFPVFRIESYLYFSASQYKLKNQDIKLLLKYIDKALEIAKTNKYVPEIMLVKVLGEQAILQWLNDDLESAFYSTEEGIELLYKKKIQDDVWKSLFAIYGHMNGYLSVLAYSGSPPSNTGDGEDYVAPMPGLFISYSEESYKHYNISKKDLILIQIIWFAEGINDYKKAAYWAKKTYESLNNSNKKMIMGASIVLYPYLILDNKFNEAIKLINEGFDLMAPPKKVKAYNILIPLMFYISNISIKDTEKAITYSDKVKKICNNKEICNKNYSLKEGANLIYRVFNGEISFKELVTLGNKYNKQDEYVLGSISYIGATLKTCTPRDAINGHFAVYPLIEKIIQPNFKKSSAIIEKIIKEFFINYWNEKFENNKFRFRTPVLAEKEIYAKIRNEDIIKILQSIKKYL
ncbi:MAG: hypothetical protein ACOCRO_05005, partial [Halanaerobiales bacterium]